jgi:hypothetical protein
MEGRVSLKASARDWGLLLLGVSNFGQTASQVRRSIRPANPTKPPALVFSAAAILTSLH